MGGRDAFGLTALHKFSSWNKTNYLELLLPKLTLSEINAICPEGKSALHYAIEMASVGSIKILIKYNINIHIIDKNGLTAMDICNNAVESNIISRLKNALNCNNDNDGV